MVFREIRKLLCRFIRIWADFFVSQSGEFFDPRFKLFFSHISGLDKAELSSDYLGRLCVWRKPCLNQYAFIRSVAAPFSINRSCRGGENKSAVQMRKKSACHNRMMKSTKPTMERVATWTRGSRRHSLLMASNAGQKSHGLPLFDQQPENDITLLIANVNDARGFRFHRDSE
jgi:hypothetical protein